MILAKFKKFDLRFFLKRLRSLLVAVFRIVTFWVILMFFIFEKFRKWLSGFRFLNALFVKIEKKVGNIFAPVKNKTDRILEKIDIVQERGTRRSFLIELAFANLMMKKSRTLMTILGMSIGVGVIVFLLSLGYGIERLVISQVASLEEMKIFDVSAGENTSLRLNKDVYEKIKSFQEVKEVVPIISLVGKLTYNKATTDVVVYSTPRIYFDFSRFKLIKGKYFAETGGVEKSEIVRPEKKGEVAGSYSEAKEGEYLAKIVPEKVFFNILPEARVKVFQECSVSSKMLGYTTRIGGGYRGDWIYGSSFYPNNQEAVIIDRKRNIYLGRWLRGFFPLYQLDLNENLVQDFGGGERQVWVEGCIPEREVEVEFPLSLVSGKILGEATGSASLATVEATSSAETHGVSLETVSVATSSGGVEVVTLQSTSSANLKQQTIEFKAPISGEAVVSSGLLNLLGIERDKAIGAEFGLTFIVVKNLMPEIDGKAVTTEVGYKIVGVIEDDNSSYIYIPFNDLYNQSIVNFSQMKVVLAKKEDLGRVRKEVETMGFKTASVVDTVNQIESLFANIRIVLSLLGLVALAVASLGMFNTLTVSLLERTREIGGMKVMGMVAEEIEDLFLGEAMIMGLAGGIGGLVLGYAAGRVVSIAFSMIAFARQRVFLNLVYIPPYFVLAILLLSFVVGMITGIYPARRAKRVSALNALRYE